MTDDDRRPGGNSRPGDSDMHRRQRGKNLFMLFALLALVVIFFILAMVRLRGTL